MKKLDDFPQFEGNGWNTNNISNGSGNTEEESESKPWQEPETRVNGSQSKELNRLIAEDLHPHDQENLLQRFPCYAIAQRRVASAEFCRSQIIKIGELY
jgi:hypothetical protein